MGWAYYILPGGREAGYSVTAECDHPDCTAIIDRGLGYLCGTMPGNDDGCGDYFCTVHEFDHACPWVADQDAARGDGADTCALCGHPSSFTCNFGMETVNGTTVHLCHASDHDCYTRWTRDGARP